MSPKSFLTFGPRSLRVKPLSLLHAQVLLKQVLLLLIFVLNTQQEILKIRSSVRAELATSEASRKRGDVHDVRDTLRLAAETLHLKVPEADVDE